MGLMKLLHGVFASKGKRRLTYHRELGEPDDARVIVRCLSCDYGADYMRAEPMIMHTPLTQPAYFTCPRCGSPLVEGER